VAFREDACRIKNGNAPENMAFIRKIALTLARSDTESKSSVKSRILEGQLCVDHVHMLIEIPPKYAVAQVIGYIKGKSAIAIARRFVGRQKGFSGQNFWGGISV
jgi:REP element-mobilizing transposase RayT